MKHSEDEVCLYIIVRGDMLSLNLGKTAAQAAHAANQCVYAIRRSGNPVLNAMLVAWEADRGFGKCIVLDGGPLAEVTGVVERALFANVHAGLVHDDSYPVRDGTVTHKIPLFTCAYMFGTKANLDPFVRAFPLR